MIFFLNLTVVLLFTFLICSIEKYSKNKTLLILFLIILTPIIWKIKINYIELAVFSFLSLIVVISKYLSNKSKIILLIISACIIVISILYIDQIVTLKLNLNFERTFIYDQKQIESIKIFQEKSTYLNFHLRKFVFGNWIIFINLIKRFFLYFWLENISSTIGLINIIPFIIGFIKKNDYLQSILIIIGVTTGILSRNPNIMIIFYFISPFLINSVIKGSFYLKNKTIFLLIFISFFMLITAG